MNGAEAFQEGQRAANQNRLSKLQAQALQQQIEIQRRTLDAQKQNDRFGTSASAHVKQCIDSANGKENPTLSGQMCVASLYQHDAEFRAGFEVMLQAADPTTVLRARELLQSNAKNSISK